MKTLYIIFILLFLFNISTIAQEKSGTGLNVDIDSLLAKYHLLGVKILVNKVGVFSIKNRTLSLKRSDFDDKLLITLYRSASFSENHFGAKFDYKLSDMWILRGESYRRSWGQQSGISFLYQIEY